MFKQIRQRIEKLDFITDNSGQNMLEYAVLATLVAAIAIAFVALFQAIKNRVDEATTEVETLDLE